MSNDRIIIASCGHHTQIMVNGKLYGDGVVKVEFSHDCTGEKKKGAQLHLAVDRLPIREDSTTEKREFAKLLREFLREDEKKEPVKMEEVEFTHIKEGLFISVKPASEIKNQKDEGERVEEVDCLIKALADHINKDLLAGKLYEQEVAEETKALALLVFARSICQDKINRKEGAEE